MILSYVVQFLKTFFIYILIGMIDMYLRLDLTVDFFPTQTRSATSPFRSNMPLCDTKFGLEDYGPVISDRTLPLFALYDDDDDDDNLMLIIAMIVNLMMIMMKTAMIVILVLLS